jgi:hypothetical protein
VDTLLQAQMQKYATLNTISLLHNESSDSDLSDSTEENNETTNVYNTDKNNEDINEDDPSAALLVYWEITCKNLQKGNTTKMKKKTKRMKKNMYKHG